MTRKNRKHDLLLRFELALRQAAIQRPVHKRKTNIAITFKINKR